MSLSKAKKVYDYTVERLSTVQRNYVSQRARVRKFSAHQLIRFREKYQFQQKTLNKILENLPAFYIDSCRSAACARTDSIYFDDEPDGVVDVVDSIIKQGIVLDLAPVTLDFDDADCDLTVAPVTDGVDGVGGGGSTKKKSGHGRQSSTSSLDFGFLFPPIRFPSRWRRRNTVDEEQGECPDSAKVSAPAEVQVSVEICPTPPELDEPQGQQQEPQVC